MYLQCLHRMPKAPEAPSLTRNAEAALADSPAHTTCLPLLPVPEAQPSGKGNHSLALPGLSSSL